MATETTKKTTKKRKKRKDVKQRIPRYRGVDGEYLAIDERDLKIGWYFPDDGEFGLMTMNKLTPDSPDNSLVTETLRKFCRENKIELPAAGQDFWFDSPAEAKKALQACNAALYFWKKALPLPEWAQRALNEGWVPPKGWSPL